MEIFEDARFSANFFAVISFDGPAGENYFHAELKVDHLPYSVYTLEEARWLNFN